MKGLRARGWDVMRSVDVFGERNDDDDLFAWAAAEGRVFVTCDEHIHATARRWTEVGRSFRMVYWRPERHREMSDGDVIAALEQLALKSDAFSYPIEYIKPRL